MCCTGYSREGWEGKEDIHRLGNSSLRVSLKHSASSVAYCGVSYNTPHKIEKYNEQM